MSNSCKKFIILLLSCFFVYTLFVLTTYADGADSFEVASVFSDNMIFQQNEDIRVWGSSRCEGEYVYARFGDSYGKSIVKNGYWEISFAPRVFSSEAQVLEVYGGGSGEYVTFENIRVGDVWWVMGQSNIEFSSSASGFWRDFENSLTGNENVYLYEVSTTDSDNHCHDRWRKLSKFSAASASALACFLSKDLDTHFNGEVPLGMVIMGYGGEELASFMPPELTEGVPYSAKKNEIYSDVIHSMIKTPIKGIIWYQGEADASVYSVYAQKLSSYIHWLRKQKSQYNSDFSVYAIELPPCFDDSTDPARQYIDFGSVRGEIGSLCADVEKFYVCPTSDLWNNANYSNNLHPDNKKEIAERLCTMLLVNEYGYGGSERFCSPQLESYTLSADKRTAIFVFDKEIIAEKLSGFLVIGDNWTELTDASLKITAANTITVSSNNEIKIVRYNTKTDSVFGKDVFLKNRYDMPVAAFSVTFSQPYVEEVEQPLNDDLPNYLLYGFVLIVICAVALLIMKINASGWRDKK